MIDVRYEEGKPDTYVHELQRFLTEALYELRYELDNRSGWVRIRLRSL